MNYPSIKTLTTRLDIEKPQAAIIRGLMRGDINPEKIAQTEVWISQCYNRPSDDELIMHAIDAVLENFGVEALGSDLGGFYRHAPQYSYSNTGDSYAATVILDNETGRFIVSSWGDLVESGKVKDDASCYNYC